MYYYNISSPYSRQLPAYNGTKSYQNLLVGVYGGQSYNSIGYRNKSDTQVHFSPVNLYRNGEYRYYLGVPYNIGYSGGYVLNKAFGFLDFADNILFPYNSYHEDDRGRGYMVRCLVPLGLLVFDLAWQLPTHNGTKSYQNLLVGVYGGQESNTTLETINSDSITQLLPFSFAHSGRYSYSTGVLSSRGSYGYYQKAAAHSAVSISSTNFTSTSLNPQDTASKGTGTSLRCLVR